MCNNLKFYRYCLSRTLEYCRLVLNHMLRVVNTYLIITTFLDQRLHIVYDTWTFKLSVGPT